MSEAACLIVNPAAGRGGVRAKLPELRETFSAHGIRTLYETSARGDEEALTARAINEGYTTIVAVGGDGTCGRIAGAILESRAGCRLAVVPAGTGNDFAKTLGVGEYTPEQIARLVARGEETRIDVGLANGNYFINSCGFGFDASVLEATSRVRFLKGDAIYIYAALKQLFTYRGLDVSADGAAGVARGRMLMVTVSLGRWLGGAFMIAPHASVLDGRLDACFIADTGVLERARLFASALRGNHVGMRSVKTASVQQLALTFADAPSMEMDGELRFAQSRTIDVRCVSRALAVMAPKGAIG